jgi:outer membrane protein TolC
MRDGFMARVRVGEAELARINALAQAMNTRVAQGGASALDQLALDARSELLKLKLSDWQRQLIDIESSTRALLDLTPAHPIPSFAAPQLADIQQQHSPQLQIALAQKEQAEAELHEAEAQGKPMTAIGVRGMYEDTNEGSERAIGASVSISLPIARGAINAQKDAARQRVLAAERLIAAEKLMIAHRLGVAQRALEQAQRATQLAEKLRLRAQAEQSSLLTASASGNVSVTNILDITDRMSALDMEVIDALVSAQQARAALWSSVVIPLFPEHNKK